MQEFAKSKGMEVIPLVQTFGHMEVSRTSGLELVLLAISATFSVGVQHHCLLFTAQCPSSVTVRAEASTHVEPERDGAVCEHPESPPKRRGEAGDGDAEASGGATSRLKCIAYRSR